MVRTTDRTILSILSPCNRAEIQISVLLVNDSTINCIVGERLNVLHALYKAELVLYFIFYRHATH